MRFVLAALAFARVAAAQEICLAFLEEHPQDPAWDKACLDELAKMPQGGMPFAGEQSQQGMSMGSLDWKPYNASAMTCGGQGWTGSQNEIMLAIDPASNPVRLFAISRSEPYDHLFAAYSDGGGCDWTPYSLALEHEGVLPSSFGDPWAAFDAFGSLWISYLGIEISISPTLVARSVDGGASFPDVYKLPATGTDKPVLATGPDTTTSPVPGLGQASGSVWVLYLDGSKVVAQGAALDANGAIIENFCGNGEPFCDPSPPLATGAFVTGDIEIGPNGEVLVTYFTFVIPNAPVSVEIFVAIDADGLGPGGFVDATPEPDPDPDPLAPEPDFISNVRAREFIDAADPERISPLSYLSWDRSTTAERPVGRVHLVYTDSAGIDSDDTDILASYSDDAGATWDTPCDDPEVPGCPAWSSVAAPLPVRVNDDLGTSSQFLPDLDVDQSTGDLVVIWRDARDDPNNEESHVYASVRPNGAENFRSSVRLSEGAGDPALTPDGSGA